MDVSVTVPEKVRAQTITEFRFTPGSKLVKVYMTDEIKGKVVQVVDMTDEIAAVSSTKKTTIKQLFKAIGAKGLDQMNEDISIDIVVGDITGDLFDDV